MVAGHIVQHSAFSSHCNIDVSNIMLPNFGWLDPPKYFLLYNMSSSFKAVLLITLIAWLLSMNYY